VILDHLELMAEAASKGLGIAYVPDSVAEPWLKRGELCAVLTEWSPVCPGLALYYPGLRLSYAVPAIRCQQQDAISLIQTRLNIYLVLTLC